MQRTTSILRIRCEADLLPVLCPSKKPKNFIHHIICKPYKSISQAGSAAIPRITFKKMGNAVASHESTNNITEMPVEVLEKILQMSTETIEDACNTALVCKHWRELLSQSNLIRFSFHKLKPRLFTLTRQADGSHLLRSFDPYPLSRPRCTTTAITEQRSDLGLAQGGGNGTGIVFYQRNKCLVFGLKKDPSTEGESFSWQQTPPMKTTKAKPLVFIAENLGKVIVADAEGSRDFRRVEMYDMKSSVWEISDPWPCPDSWVLNGLLKGDKLYLMTGSRELCVCLDLKTLGWRCLRFRWEHHVKKRRTETQSGFRVIDGGKNGLLLAGWVASGMRLRLEVWRLLEYSHLCDFEKSSDCSERVVKFAPSCYLISWKSSAILDRFLLNNVRRNVGLSCAGDGDAIYFYTQEMEHLLIYEIGQQRWRTFSSDQQISKLLS